MLIVDAAITPPRLSSIALVPILRIVLGTSAAAYAWCLIPLATSYWSAKGGPSWAHKSSEPQRHNRAVTDKIDLALVSTKLFVYRVSSRGPTSMMRTARHVTHRIKQIPWQLRAYKSGALRIRSTPQISVTRASR